MDANARTGCRGEVGLESETCGVLGAYRWNTRNDIG